MRVWGRTKRVGALALLFLCLAILGQPGATAQTSTATLIGPIAKFRRTSLPEIDTLDGIFAIGFTLARTAATR